MIFYQPGKRSARKQDCGQREVEATEPKPVGHMFQVMSFYLVSAQTQRGFWGRKFPAPHSPLLTPLRPPFPVLRSDKAVGPSRCTVLPNKQDLGMRRELYEGPSRGLLGESPFLSFTLMGSRRVEYSDYHRPLDGRTEPPPNTPNIYTF